MERDRLLKYLDRFVQDLEQKGCLRSPWLKQALFKVPRHLFIDQFCELGPSQRVVPVDRERPPDEQLSRIYSNDPILIRHPPHTSSSSKPDLVVEMLEDLEIERGNKVLEIGTGTGWNAGLLAFGVGDDSLVHSVDIQADLVEEAAEHLRDAGFGGVNLKAGDAGYGWPEAAPFDRIIVTCGSPDIPPAWVEQLADGGVLVVPLRAVGWDPLLRLRRHRSRLDGEFTRWTNFMPIEGTFSSDLECPIGPWSDPLIKELLRQEPKKAPVPERPSLERDTVNDCLFFLRLEVEGMRLLYSREPEISWPGALFDQESGSICVMLPDEAALEVYGDQSLAQRFAAAQQEWIKLGRPRITDYRVELVDPGAAALEANTWLDKRPHATLKLSLPRN